MKKLGLLFALLMATTVLFAQSNGSFKNIKVKEVAKLQITGMGVSSVDGSALLEMESTTKGILIPRMTLAQRDAIGSPATGLLVYQLDNTPGFYKYTGAAWLQLGGASDLEAVLGVGNTTGANNVSITTGQKIIYNNGAFTADILEPTLAGDIDLTLPSSTGTIALVSDIPAATGDGIYTGSGSLSAATTVTLSAANPLNFTGGQSTFRGSGNTSGTYSFLAENSDATKFLGIRDDGRWEYRAQELLDYNLGNDRIYVARGFNQLNLDPTGVVNCVSDFHVTTINSLGGGSANNITLGSSNTTYKANNNASSGINHYFNTNLTVTGANNHIVRIANNGTVLFAVDKDANTAIGLTDPSSRLHVKGSGVTSGTTSLLIENSASTEKFRVTDDGQVRSADGYWIGTSLFVSSKGTNHSTYIGASTASNATGVQNTIMGAAAGFVLTTGTQNSFYGYHAGVAVTLGRSNTLIGDESGKALAGVTSNDHSFNTAIGYLSLSSAVGATYNSTIGVQSGNNITGGDFNTCLGYLSGATSSGSYSNSIAIGKGAMFDASNQMVIGGAAGNEYINALYLGAGKEDTGTGITPTTFTLQTTSIKAGVTDVSPSYDFIIAAPQGTGTGVGGDLILKTAPAGTTGTAQNALVEALKVDASKVAGETRFLIYDVDNGTLERVTVGAADSGGAGFKVLRIAN